MQRSTGLAIGVLVAVALAACGAPNRPAGPEGAASGLADSAAAPAAASQATLLKARGSYVVISSIIAPTWIAQDEGYFRKHGLDVELVYIAGAVPNAEALIAGDIDFAIAPATSAIGPGLEGADLVMLASWAPKTAFSLMVGSDVSAVEDLRGKRVGIVRRGSNSEIWATAVLGQYGLQADRDFILVAVGGQPEQIAALQNGAIDAAVLTPPINLRARHLGFRELLHYRDNALDFTNAGVVVSRRYLQERTDTVERLLRAHAEGVATLVLQDEIAMAVLSRYTQIDERDLLEETLGFERSRTLPDMIPTAAGMRGAMQELAINNPKAASANPMDFVDLTLVQRLNDSGYVRALYP